MNNKTIYSFLIFIFLSIQIGQTQIATKGIDLSYLQKLVQFPKSESIPKSFENVTMSRMPPMKIAHLKAGSDTFHINFIDVMTAGQLRILSDTLDNNNYPLTILHKDVFSTYSQLLLEYDLLIYKYTELEKTADRVQTLQELEMKELKNIIHLEQEKSKIIRDSREEIMVQTKYLNDQLDSSLKIQKKIRKRTFGKNFLVATIGGAVGLATGILLMEFAR